MALTVGPGDVDEDGQFVRDNVLNVFHCQFLGDLIRPLLLLLGRHVPSSFQYQVIQGLIEVIRS